MKSRYTLGGCESYFSSTIRVCGKAARYLVYGDRRLCKGCYQRWAAGRKTLFLPREIPTALSRWDLQRRLSEMVNG